MVANNSLITYGNSHDGEGLPIETIVAITQLSAEQIENLRGMN